MMDGPALGRGSWTSEAAGFGLAEPGQLWAFEKRTSV